jgi:hypothetical protein
MVIFDFGLNDGCPCLSVDGIVIISVHHHELFCEDKGQPRGVAEALNEEIIKYLDWS